MNACAACHGNMIRQKSIIDLRIDGKLYVIKNVDYEVCEICGEKVVSPDVSSRVYENIKILKTEDTLQKRLQSLFWIALEVNIKKKCLEQGARSEQNHLLHRRLTVSWMMKRSLFQGLKRNRGRQNQS